VTRHTFFYVDVVGKQIATHTFSDDNIVRSDAKWLIKEMNSVTSTRSEVCAHLLEALAMGLRAASVVDVRDALATVVSWRSDATARQYVLRVKSLLGYASSSAIRFSTQATVALRSPSASP
jgi:hypothetical protein